MFVQVSCHPLSLTYICSDMHDVGIGSVVKVEIGSKDRFGVVTDILQNSPQGDFKVKEIKAVLHQVFTKEMIPFLEWIAQYYQTSLSYIIKYYIPFIGPNKYSQIEQYNTVTRNQSWNKKYRDKNKLKLLSELNGESSYDNLCKAYGKTLIAGMIKDGSINASYQSVVQSSLPALIDLNEEQKKAVQEVSALFGTASPCLLYGITGSGKTETYLELIRRTLANHKGCLVLVPEIALTPQLEARFQSKLPGVELAILHSGLSPRLKSYYWQKIIAREIHVVIGARSAIFAPIPELGLIVVDEEHDSSFKHQEGIRYNAKELAFVRAKLDQCPVVLGSATPSLETYEKATKGDYRFIRLNQRFLGSTPAIKFVNVSELSKSDFVSSHISAELFSSIKEALARHEQVFILINQRGYSPYLQCGLCKGVIQCPNCAVSLTVHRKPRYRLKCHFCGYERELVDSCDELEPAFKKSCLAQANVGVFKMRGLGTDKVYEQLQSLLPDARILQVDRDTASSYTKLKEYFSEIKNHAVDIVVGTQMIAKGHDIHNVTLVGVIDADIGIHLPDFRASERVTQLLMQISGRVGRGHKPGNVIIQTRSSNHPSRAALEKNDYELFLNEELPLREMLTYPPYSSILRLLLTSENETNVATTTSSLKKVIERIIESAKLEVDLIGESPAPVAKLESFFRFQILLKSARKLQLIKLISLIKEHEYFIKEVEPKFRVVFDVDPYDLK